MKKLISRRNFLKMGALASAVMMLAACGGGAGGGKDAGANVDVTGAVSFPLAEQVTFTGMTSYPVGSESDPNNRTIFKRLEEATNVHIDWTAIQADQWSDKITLNMSNPSTLTDFVFTADFSDSDLLRYADQALLSIWRTTSTTICPTSRRFLRCTRSTVPCVQIPRDISGRCRGSSSWALKRRRSKRWEI